MSGCAPRHRRARQHFRGLRAVHDVSFTVPAGAIHALIGPNGAGKTTIFNMIAGVFAPDLRHRTPGWRGDIWPAARSHLRRRRRPHLPARQAVQGSQRPGKRHRGRAAPQDDLAQARDGAATILSRLGLYDRRHQLAENLTLPDRKRLEVARALATEPKLLLLDEVMAVATRPTEVDVMVRFLRELSQSTGLTILLIEHVMRAVMALAAEVVVW